MAKKDVGLHLIGDFYNVKCPRSFLVNGEELEKICKHLVQKSGLTTVGSLFHQFGEDGGVTGAVILAESHLAIHCWPEKDYVTLDVFVCNYNENNRDKAYQLFEDLTELFAPEITMKHSIDRE